MLWDILRSISGVLVCNYRERRLILVRRRLPPRKHVIMVLLLWAEFILLGHREPVNSVRATEARSGFSSPRDTTFRSFSDAMHFARDGRCTPIDTSRSTWILGAEYCVRRSEQSGYLLVNLKGRWYIHSGVPTSVSLGLGRATSPGAYYNRQLRGRYRLVLAQ